MATFTVAERTHAASLTAFPHPIRPWTTPPSGPLPAKIVGVSFSKGPLPAGALQAPSPCCHHRHPRQRTCNASVPTAPKVKTPWSLQTMRHSPRPSGVNGL